ncbi:MAG TPA: tRNA (adenosine(37)-N6)-threonylcarbamoyltransferase complex dimerization subunit type 1 TsaB [Vicinamibacteria bacterium]|nr:tRNA (adenosine(37)-N6)-threonylcarbamoyltransferase complex dimerization subunit type 1 TsaB [Vicinamibacteria bacterium]
MRVLAVDTSSARGSLAVAGPEGVLAEARVVTAEGHSRWLLPGVAALLQGVGIDAASLDLFAVTTGPGSFTGLRVGLGSVQGLALASGRPCVGLSTLDVLAASAAGSSGTIVAVVDAFRGEVYSGVYDASGRLRGERAVGPLAAVLEGVPAGSAFVGDVAVAEREAIRRAVPGATFPDWARFLAPALAIAALPIAASGAAVSAADLRPLYLRAAAIRPSRP